MKAIVTIEDVKVLDIQHKTNQDGSINWDELVFIQDSNCNTVTCSLNVGKNIKAGKNYHLIMEITEVPKAYKNGGGAYMQNKFKIVEAYEAVKE